jgi:uncharacterized protein with ParB-like and HNH nuclease domain
MNDLNRNTKNLADKLFPVRKDEDYEILDIPPEQRKLHTETYDFSISTIVEYLNEGHIIIPKFQREFVWNRAQASRLIESLIIQCPIPVLYLSQTPDEHLSVIDGNQRLNSIKLFLENKFPLKGLTAYPELEGYKYSELDPRFQRHIINRTLRCIVILKETHPQIKFDVFERLNTGSVKLNAQELRHGLHQGKLMEILEELSQDEIWMEMTGTKNDKRMKSDELILRFLALYFNLENYRKPFLGFLNDFSERNRNPSKESLLEMKQVFLQTIHKVSKLFDKYSFKLFDSSLNIKSSFNAALYDAEMIAIAKNNLSIRQIEKINKPKFLFEASKLFNNKDFSKYISSGTSDAISVKSRILMFEKLLKNYI